jgi:hypothetical protein
MPSSIHMKPKASPSTTMKGCDLDKIVETAAPSPYDLSLYRCATQLYSYGPPPPSFCFDHSLRVERDNRTKSLYTHELCERLLGSSTKRKQTSEFYVKVIHSFIQPLTPQRETVRAPHSHSASASDNINHYSLHHVPLLPRHCHLLFVGILKGLRWLGVLLCSVIFLNATIHVLHGGFDLSRSLFSSALPTSLVGWAKMNAALSLRFRRGEFHVPGRVPTNEVYFIERSVRPRLNGLLS